MVMLKRSDMRVLDDAFEMHQGYVLNFSDSTFAEFFEDELGIDIDDDKYRINGSSKAKRLRAFIEIEDAFLVSKVCRRLWSHREGLPSRSSQPGAAELKARFFDLLTRLEGGGEVARTDALYQFKPDETLEELVAAIERDIAADKPAAALDRLHTYCMKKFAHLLNLRGLSCDRNDPLHSRIGKYVKALEGERELRGITRQIIKSAISVFEQFNDVRNNRSFAHDNDLVDKTEARFIFDAVSAILRFAKALEAARFEN